LIIGRIDIGVDLGTASVLVYQKGKGIILQEPSVVAIDKVTQEPLAIGAKAREMLGRTPEDIEAIRPLCNGVISNYRLTALMLQHFIEEAVGTRTPFNTLRMIICVPSSVTEVERRSVDQAAREVGAQYVRLVEEPLAAALGAGLAIEEVCGHMVVDIGGGTTDVAVLSSGGVVKSETIKVAGDHFDQALIRYLRQKYSLLIGERTAENVKMRIGSVDRQVKMLSMDVTGRSLVSGLPKTLTITSDETMEAYESQTVKILDKIRDVLEETPAELVNDIYDQGIVLTGGGAMVRGLADRVSRYTELPCRLAEDPVSCVVLGTSRLLEDPNAFRRIPKTRKKDYMPI